MGISYLATVKFWESNVNNSNYTPHTEILILSPVPLYMGPSNTKIAQEAEDKAKQNETEKYV